MTYIKCLEGNKREYMEKRNFTVKKKKKEAFYKTKLMLGPEREEIIQVT